ncbi:MAG: hypothetical protein U0836_07615 [Pirellulales bacterium]
MSCLSKFTRLIILALLAAACAPATAAFIEPSDSTGSFGADPAGWGNGPNTVATTRTTPLWNRPDIDSEAASAFATYQAWDVFTVIGAGKANGPNAPGVDPNPPRVEGPETNPNGTAAVFELTGSGFVTGSGNIYSPGAPVSMQADVPNYNLGAGYQTHVVLQIRSQGNSINLDSLTVNGVLATTLAGYSYQEVFKASLGPQGSLLDHKFEFTLPGNQALDSFAWTAPDSSSQDKVSIDTRATPVPEPASFVLLAAGLGLLSLHRPLRPRGRAAQR